MKKLLTITAILISVVSFGQNLKLYKSTDDIVVSDLLYRKYIDNGNSPYQFWNWGKNPEQIGVIRSSGKDTLEITYPSLVERKNLFKYIKIGDKVFQEVEPKIEIKNWYASPNGWTSYLLNLPTVDTSFILKRIKNNDSISSFRLSDWYKISDSTREVINKNDTSNYSYKGSIPKTTYSIYYDGSAKNYLRGKYLQNNKNKKVKKQDLSNVFYVGVSDTSAMAVGVFSPKNLRKLEEERLKLLQHDNKEFRKYLIEKFKVSAEDAAKEADRRYAIKKNN